MGDFRESKTWVDERMWIKFLGEIIIGFFVLLMFLMFEVWGFKRFVKICWFFKEV